MGSFKEKGREGVREIGEKGKEATKIGEKMNQEAQAINSVLESIQLQDEDDMGGIEQGRTGYHDSFDSAFDDQVDTKNQEVASEGQQINQEMSGELQNVEGGIQSLDQAAGMSEVGKENADGAKTVLEASEQEYEDIIDEAAQVVEGTNQEVQNLKNNLSGIFKR